MRALHVPQITVSEVMAESDYTLHRDVMRAIRTTEPSQFYLWLRRGDEEQEVGGPDITLFYEESRLVRSFYALMAYADLPRLVDLFGWQTGPYPTDVVFTSRAVIAPLLQLAMGCCNGQYEMPVVITEPRVYGSLEGPHHNLVTPTQLALRAAGYATCYGLYWSKWEKGEALNAASAYVTDAVLKGWEERSFVVDALVNLPPEDVTNAVRPSDPKRLLFAGRLNSNKRWREVLASYASVFQSRTDVEVWVHSGTGAFTKMDPAEHHWHATSERLPALDYWQLLRTAHVAAYASTDEGANVTTQELIAAGVTMVLPKRPWVRKLFDPYDYPFVATDREMPTMIDWCLDHWQETFDRLAPIRAMIAQERGWESYRSKFASAAEAIVRHPRPPAYRTFRKIALEQMGPDGIGWATMRQLVPGWKSSRPGDAAVRSAMSCYNAVRDLDDLASAEVWLKKEVA